MPNAEAGRGLCFESPLLSADEGRADAGRCKLMATSLPDSVIPRTVALAGLTLLSSGPSKRVDRLVHADAGRCRTRSGLARVSFEEGLWRIMALTAHDATLSIRRPADVKKRTSAGACSEGSGESSGQPACADAGRDSACKKMPDSPRTRFPPLTTCTSDPPISGKRERAAAQRATLR